MLAYCFILIQHFMTCINLTEVLVVAQDIYMLISASFRADVMYCWVDVGNDNERRNVRV